MADRLRGKKARRHGCACDVVDHRQMKRVRKYHKPAVYQIRVEGVLDPCWSEWFETMVITTEAEATLLTGPVRDQAALHGLLGRIRDLGLSILLVKRINGPFSNLE